MSTLTRLRRALVAASAGTALLAAMTGCSSFGTGDQDAAHAAAAEYARLIESGDDLEALWTTTLTAESAPVRDAGRMLAAASERIEVLHLSEAEPAEVVLDRLYEADLDTQAARQVTVSYRLAGTEHESTMALAPRENQPRDEPGSWVVVTPLLGAMTVPPVGFAAVVLDTYVGDVYAQVGDNHSEQELLLYPAVYDLQQRADPYFSSDSVDLTVIAGQSVSIPQLEVVPTDETVAILADQLVSWLESCVDEPGECSSSIYDLVEEHGFEPSRYDWSFEVTTEPQLTAHGDEVEFTGGTLTLHGPDGSATDIAFEGSSSWTMPMQTWTPTLLGFATELRAVAG